MENIQPIDQLNRKVWEFFFCRRLMDHHNVRAVMSRGIGHGVWAFFRDMGEMPIMRQAAWQAEQAPALEMADIFLRDFNARGGYVLPRGSDAVSEKFSEFIRIPTAGEYDITQLLCAVLFTLNVHVHLYRNGLAHEAIVQTIKEMTFKAYILFRAIAVADAID